MHKEKRSTQQRGQKLIIRIMAVLLALVFVLSLGSQIFVYAHAAELEPVGTLRSRQKELAQQQQSYQNQLDDLTEQKASAVSKYMVLAKQNEVIAEQIEDSKELLGQCKEQIKKAAKELKETKEVRDQCYEIFCERAAQMEQGGAVTLWETIFSSRTITELLTSVNDMKAILSNDRKTLDDVETLEQQVAEKEAQLKSEKKEQENQLSELKKQKEELEENEAEAAAAMEEIQQNMDLYMDQIAQLGEEQLGLEADIREAETLAAQKAAEEKAARENAAAAAQETRAAVRTPDAETTAAEEAETETEPAVAAVEETEENSAPAEKPQAPAAPVSSGNGGAVVAYALQFVGNPYVWGGTSLTNGCDCSGFVKSVYARFGYDLPHFSGSLRHCGTGVSYAEAQPGDVICYDGHVGIYMGDGAMVNAFDSKHGIIICSVNTSRLVAVRRIL